MTLDGTAAPLSADAAQAAHFRALLVFQRQQLLEGMLDRRRIDDSSAAGSRLPLSVHHAEVEVRYLDRLIERLDRRFEDHWQGRDRC